MSTKRKAQHSNPANQTQMTNERMAVEDVKKVHQVLRDKLADKAWIATQDEEFVNYLRMVEQTIHNISAQIYVFVDIFEQYIRAVYASPVFMPPAVPDTPESDDVSEAPTQTSASADASVHTE